MKNYDGLTVKRKYGFKWSSPYSKDQLTFIRRLAFLAADFQCRSRELKRRGFEVASSREFGQYLAYRASARQAAVFFKAGI